MSKQARVIASAIVALALVGSVLTTALAHKSYPFHLFSQPHAVKHFTINGALTVTDVLRVQKNTSVFGRTYSHGGAQVWKGLLIHSGGIKTDSLDASGVIQGQSETITGALQAGSISATSLNVHGDIQAGGAVSAVGKITGNGLDGGAGGVTTTGTITGGALTVASVNDSGTLAAGNITTAGSLQAGTTTLSNLTVNGPVNLSNATVTGLNLSGTLNGATVQTFNVGQVLTVGSLTSSIPPLILKENNQSTQISVDPTGALDTGNLVVGIPSQTSTPLTLNENGKSLPLAINTAGSLTVDSLVTTNTTTGLTVTGTAGIVASSLVAPTPSGSGQSPLVLQGGGISLRGTTTLDTGSDLILRGSPGSSSPTASHFVAPSNPDVGGVVTITVPINTAANVPQTQTVNFLKSYANTPTVTATFASNPIPTGAGTGYPLLWVTATTTGFTVNFQAPALNTGQYTVNVAYHVVGT